MVGGLKYGPERIEQIKQAAPLKSETDMGECADAFVMLAKSSTCFVVLELIEETITGASLTVDAGLSLKSG
jgi:hypothetical protein